MPHTVEDTWHSIIKKHAVTNNARWQRRYSRGIRTLLGLQRVDQETIMRVAMQLQLDSHGLKRLACLDGENVESSEAARRCNVEIAGL